MTIDGFPYYRGVLSTVIATTIELSIGYYHFCMSFPRHVDKVLLEVRPHSQANTLFLEPKLHPFSECVRCKKERLNYNIQGDYIRRKWQ